VSDLHPVEIITAGQGAGCGETFRRDGSRRSSFGRDGGKLWRDGGTEPEAGSSGRTSRSLHQRPAQEALLAWWLCL